MVERPIMDEETKKQLTKYIGHAKVEELVVIIEQKKKEYSQKNLKADQR
jgi:hypothetical protein